ncbi:MAG TPA: DinB family protein [Candidatus Limnocylindria bacterium]|nr:DinB family protein [Candidatus Limnocylindria bacterium]
MPRQGLPRDETLRILETTVGRIGSATAGIAPACLRRASARGEWSINEILAHLRSVADARGEFIRAILAERRPTLRAIDPRSWIEQTDYRELEFEPSFRAFRRQRTRLLTLLHGLTEAGWARTAIVTGGGPPRERTVLFYAQWVARHERAHVKQIERLTRTMTR